MPQNYDNETVVQDAWHRVLFLSFPMPGIVNGRTVVWRILRSTDLYPPIARIPNGQSLSAFKLAIGPARPDLRAAITGQDYLLVQTARPRFDTSAGWRDLLLVTCTKLLMCGGQHQIFIICAIGLRYMLFFWDPQRANQPPTLFRGSPPTAQYYALPPQLLSLGPAPHMNRQFGGMIVLEHTQALHINPDLIRNPIGLEAMEQYLFAVKSVILDNANTAATIIP